MPVTILSESDSFFYGSYCSPGSSGRARSLPSDEARQEPRSTSVSKSPKDVRLWFPRRVIDALRMRIQDAAHLSYGVSYKRFPRQRIKYARIKCARINSCVFGLLLSE
ncbi:hypothetical protein J6590_059267 [Homalodisca vitripennis]|nr:hypothetical protein J6590_059267 [Homalodisca vitripennis]